MEAAWFLHVFFLICDLSGLLAFILILTIVAVLELNVLGSTFVYLCPCSTISHYFRSYKSEPNPSPICCSPQSMEIEADTVLTAPILSTWHRGS